MDAPIVGRGPELGQLRAALVAASEGAGRLVLISGEPGIGKTRLARAATELAGQYGVPVAAGAALDDPGMPPLWPWRGVSRSVPALATVLTDAAGPADGTGGGSLTGAGDSASERFVMFAAACQALADTAAGRGLLVVLEDLQWADRTSLLLLRHLAGELAGRRLLVLATARETTGPPLAELLPELLRGGEARPIRLTGLGRPDIAQWLRQLGPDGDPDERAGRLQASTGGNPLLVRMLIERGPSALDDGLRGFPELRRLVLTQVGGLPDAARDLLDVASVLGEQIDPPLLAEVSGLSAAETGAILDEATALGVLAAAPDVAGLSFAHALVRDAIYDELAPSRRMALHQRAARALEQSVLAAACAGQIATHWQRSGQPGWAAPGLRWAREAARSAAAALAYDEAARFTALALRAAEADPAPSAALRAELTLEAAQAEFMAGHIEASLARCQAAGGLAEAAGRPDLLAAAALVITGMGDPPTTTAVEALCAAALAALPAEDTALRARLRARQAIAAAETGSGIRARDLSAEALALAEASGDPDALLDGLHARHLSLCAPQFLAERRDLASGPVRSPAGPVSRWPNCGATSGWSTRRSRPGTWPRWMTTRPHRAVRGGQQARFGLVAPVRLQASRAALVGDLAAAIELNEAAREVANRIGADSTIGMYYAFLNQLAILRGTVDPEAGQPP